MRIFARTLLASSLLVALGPALTRADVPLGVSHQGVLLDPNGAPVNGNVNLQFRVWRHPTFVASGDLLYQENHLSVPVLDGVYAVVLGNGTSASGAFDASLFGESTRWLEIAVDGQTLAPRQALTSVPYALQSQQCANSETVAGQTPAQIVTQSQTGLSFSNIAGAITAVQMPAGFVRDIDVPGIVKATDGSGSGYDADLLDGLSSEAFSRLGASIETSEISDGAVTDAKLTGPIGGAKIDGSSLTNLNASALASGTVPSARLSGTYAQPLTLTNAFISGAFAGVHYGDGSGLSVGLASTAAPLDGCTLESNQVYCGGANCSAEINQPCTSLVSECQPYCLDSTGTTALASLMRPALSSAGLLSVELGSMLACAGAPLATATVSLALEFCPYPAGFGGCQTSYATIASRQVSFTTTESTAAGFNLLDSELAASPYPVDNGGNTSLRLRARFSTGGATQRCFLIRNQVPGLFPETPQITTFFLTAPGSLPTW